MSVPILAHGGEMLARYDIIVSDVWGVVHDGLTAHAPACEALARARKAGVTVVLLSNYPGTGAMAAQLLAEKGVPRESWDAIVTSGDITRAHLIESGARRILHIGTQRDRDIFNGLDLTLVRADAAQMIVATELRDDRTESPEDYRAELAALRARNLPFLCGNPDFVVHVGEDLLPCAGALAAIYEEMGGKVYWAGKPHPPAFEAALKAARQLRGASPGAPRALMIGDTLRTDLAGAKACGLDGLFIAGGVHRDETMTGGGVDALAVRRLCAAAGLEPVAAMAVLAW